MVDDESIITWDKNITPEQKALLRGHNFREYPTIQELTAENIVENFENTKLITRKNVEKSYVKGKIIARREQFG